MNAIRTIREEEGERSEIALVSAETPYSRMVLPYFLDRSIAESHVFTATPRVLADWGVKAQVGRRATALDTKATVCTPDDGTRLVEDWLTKHGVAIRTGAKLTRIEDAKGRKRLRFAAGGDLVCDVVIMATGIKTNLEWLKGSGVTVNRGVVVDDRLRSSVPNVYAAGDIAEGRDLIT